MFVLYFKILRFCAFMIIWCSLHYCDCKGIMIWVSPALLLCVGMYMCMCVYWNILWNKLTHHGFYFLVLLLVDRHMQILVFISYFILGKEFKWWEGPVWLWKEILFPSTNSSYQRWCSSRNNTPTSAWVWFDYKSNFLLLYFLWP